MSPRPVQHPTETVHEFGGGTERRFEHPAFAQIGASRVSGSTTLYGSDFIHNNFVRITIRRSDLHRDLSKDWHYATEDLIEVDLSEAQWASFVSSMNVGMGVPCTLARLMNESMPSIPVRTQQDAFRGEVDASAQRANELVCEAIADIEGELGTSMSGKKRDAILARLRKLQRVLGDTMPFVVDGFDRHMEKSTERAKVEVSAYVHNVLQRAGLAHLLQDGAPLQLGTGGPVEEPADGTAEIGGGPVADNQEAEDNTPGRRIQRGIR